MLKIKESNIYINEIDILPDLINSNVSNEKVENVVKDPRMPIITKYLIIISEISLLSK